MPFKLPYFSLGLRRLVSGKAPSGKPWARAIQNRVTVRDPVQKRLAQVQGRPLRRIGAQRHVVCPPTHRQLFRAGPAQPPPPADKDKPEPTSPEGFEMSEAEILEREMDPSDKDSAPWPPGADMLWLDDVPEPGEQGQGPTRLPRGPYIQTAEGLVHIATYFP